MGLNKKAQTTLGLFAVIFIGLFIMIFLIAVSYGAGQVDDAFSLIDINISNKSFQEEYQNTLQPGIQALETQVPLTISVGSLLGLIIVMMLVGYFSEEKSRLWILFDILVIIGCEYLAVLARDVFTEYINSNPALLQIASTTLSAGGRFILTLPFTLPIIGILIMFATYIRKKEKLNRGVSVDYGTEF